MLKFISRLERTRKSILLVFALLMGLSLIFFYAPSRNSANANPANSRETLASVGRREVTVGDFTRLKENFMQQMAQFGGQLSLAQLGGDKRILDNLIRERMIAQEAERLGLAPSDAEVRDAIRRQFTDSAGKFVGFDRYKEIVVSQYGNVESFEESMRYQVARDKLEAFVTAGVRVSDEEVQEQYQRQNTTFDLVYVPVTAAELAKRVTPTDEELRRYYDEHKTEFRIQLPQKKIRYLFIDQAKVGERLELSEEELRKEYDALAPENKQAGVRVQQIVLRVARPELEDEVRAKAEDLVRRARGEGGTATEEAFAELARGNSEDPATARNGGALAGLVRKNPNKPDDPLQSTLNMEPGQVSEPIKFGNAFYIFRRGESVPKTFEEARRELEVSLRNRRSYAAAAQLAARAAERLKESKDFQRVAAELAPEANMSPSEMVRETDFIVPGDDVPDIGTNPQFEQAIEPLDEPQEVGERVSIKGGFAVPMLVERRDPRIPEFDEVRERVAERVRQEKAAGQLEQVARELAANAGSAADLRAAAERLGLKAETADDYKLSTPLGQVGTSPVADEAIYQLQAGGVTRTPVKVGETWVVIGETERKDADLAEFAAQRETLVRQELATRRNAVFEDYLAATRARMERDGEIKVHQDVLARITDDDPFAAPFQGGLPPASGR